MVVNITRISIYEKFISKRLSLPIGARKNLHFHIPNWIYTNKNYSLRYLRGLFEAEGSLSFHAGTYTHKFSFSNRNESLLKIVYRLLIRSGFHPSIGNDRVQLSRKDEVKKAVELFGFRKY